MNRPQLLENFGKIFGASETALPAGIAAWLGGINIEASPYATTHRRRGSTENGYSELIYLYIP